MASGLKDRNAVRRQIGRTMRIILRTGRADGEVNSVSSGGSIVSLKSLYSQEIGPLDHCVSGHSYHAIWTSSCAIANPSRM